MADADKLTRARCRIAIREPFYGHASMLMDWRESDMPWMPKEQRTMGVRIVQGGRIECLYYPPFVEKLTLEQLYGVVQHEIEHVIRLHVVRCGQRQPLLFNIAADMTVNGKKDNPRIGYKEDGKKIIFPTENAVFIPDDWPDDETAEFYYDKFPKIEIEMCNCDGEEGEGESAGDSGSGKDSKGGKDKKKDKGGDGDEDDKDDKKTKKIGGVKLEKCPKCGKWKLKGNLIDDHSIWRQSDVSEDEARQVVKDMVDQASAKCQGNVPGHLEEAIKALNKPVVRWREIFRQLVGTYCGGRRITYARRNRRNDNFGIPGQSHHATAKVCVIVDTSGSIDTKMLEQFFTEIEAITYKTTVNVLQWDMEFQGFGRYKRGEWRKYKVHGRGGTSMKAACEWAVKNGVQGDALVLLTDGETDWPDDLKIPFICVIANNREIEGPKWGKVIKTDLVNMVMKEE